MTTAAHLVAIDRLRTRGFPAARSRSVTERSGPGYHLVELGESHWYGDEDAADRIAGADQISAEYGALTQGLTERWGEPQVFSLGSLLDRVVSGEEVPEPWGR